MKLDPLALAVHAVAVLVVILLVGFVLLSLRSDPTPAGSPLADAVEQARKAVESAVEQSRRPAPPAPKATPPKPQSKPAPTPKPVAKSAVPPLAAGRMWSYRVTVEPPQWRDARLDYRTVEMVSGIAVYTEFRHADGKMNFQLGTFAPNHASHANMRFPGFFMYPAYFDKPLDIGQRLSWQWPWQLPGGGVREGRIKRYDGVVMALEEVRTPAGSFAAARIDAVLSYIENGRVMGSATETLWYSPRAMQLVKVVRQGRTPDEGLDRIVAELAELK